MKHKAFVKFITIRVGKKNILTPFVRKLLIIASVMFVVAVVYVFYIALYLERIFPNTYVAGVNVSSMSVVEASRVLSARTLIPPEYLIVSGEHKFAIKPGEISLTYDFSKSAERAFTRGRSGSLFTNVYDSLVAITKRQDYGLVANMDEEAVAEYIATINGQVSVDPVYPSVELVAGKVVVEKGSVGRVLDSYRLRSELAQQIAWNKNGVIYARFEVQDQGLDTMETALLERKASNLVGRSVILVQGQFDLTLSDAETIKLLGVKEGFNNKELASLYDRLVVGIEQEAHNPVFVFEDGIVKEFEPSRDGVSIEYEKFVGVLRDYLDEPGIETEAVEIAVPIKITEPELATGEINNLGIKELIGSGTSYFRGSAAARIHNIALASSRLNGLLIKPGEDFSFNEAIGDISEYTGYKQAFVIKDGRTVLGDGGGVCQVSTTLFRAILDSGLPITERRPHSYRVSYYEQGFSPGIDATVYAPYADLKFKNDTPGHILIQTTVNRTYPTLTFELYGTNDGRKASITKPKITAIIPAPPDVYRDDPSMPSGEIKQVEYRASGAKVFFNYSVEKDGVVILEKTFNSYYKPWAAVYLRGVGQKL